jgi:16S rRNA (adenine1518-N6/adenine1519-N6)-dimethyltransferase
MVLMVQREAADRFLAGPGDKNYVPLTVLSRLLFDVSCVLELSPASYYPQPDVSSSVLLFESNGAMIPEGLPRFLNCAFAMRRKTLANNLTAMGMTKTDAAELIRSVGFDPSVRAEALEPDSLLSLFQHHSAYFK